MERNLTSTATAAPRRPAFQPALSLRVAAWLRKTHGWIGLWGAVLGLLFGTAGLWLNHRAVLKLPMQQQRAMTRMALPDPAPRSAQELAAWLQQALPDVGAPNMVRVEPAKRAPWSEDGERVQQPEHWMLHFGGPHGLVQADYWRGNHSVAVTRIDNGFVATLANLHKGVGMSVPWILLVDSLAGSLVFLCLSGVALWMLTHRRRLVPGLAILGASVAVTAGLVLARL